MGGKGPRGPNEHMRTNILIVDDDPALVRAARGLLARRDCHVEAVFSGLDAVARVRAGGIDAVLLDVWMPEVDGLSVLDELSRLPNPPRTVLMSGNVDDRVEAAVAAGRALAYTLLAGKAPDRPLQLQPELDRASLATFASQIVSRGTGFLESAPQLPPATPVSVALATPEGALGLLAIADLAVRAAGKRGLGLRFAELTATQLQSLKALASPAPEPMPAAKEAPPDRGRELYRRALEKIELGKYDSALLDLRQARDLQPGDPLIQTTTIHTKKLAGVEKARSLFREAEQLSEQDPAQALRLIEDAIHLDQTRAPYHREAARLYLHLGTSLQQAEEHLAIAIHLAPSDPAPRLHLAQLLERVGRPQEALWACEAALGLFPGDKELGKLATRLRRKTSGGAA